MGIKLYRIEGGIILEQNGRFYKSLIPSWDVFFNDDRLYQKCQGLCISENVFGIDQEEVEKQAILPAQSQEIWATGVTYFNSKLGREEEAKEAGGSNFYARVYVADRPELFFKSTPSRAVAHREKIAIRKDSTWNVPEPELTLCISSTGKIIGYTIGDDMSSRSIEGENPLYLPQAKSYDRSAGLGPCIFVTDEPLPSDTRIQLTIERDGKEVFYGDIKVDQIVRKFEDLVGYLYKEMTFPYGSFLMTGTGIVPSSDFTLEVGDIVKIEIDHIGTLMNTVDIN